MVIKTKNSFQNQSLRMSQSLTTVTKRSEEFRRLSVADYDVYRLKPQRERPYKVALIYSRKDGKSVFFGKRSNRTRGRRRIVPWACTSNRPYTQKSVRNERLFGKRDIPSGEKSTKKKRKKKILSRSSTFPLLLHLVDGRAYGPEVRKFFMFCWQNLLGGLQEKINRKVITKLRKSWTVCRHNFMNVLRERLNVIPCMQVSLPSNYPFLFFLFVCNQRLGKVFTIYGLLEKLMDSSCRAS